MKILKQFKGKNTQNNKAKDIVAKIQKGDNELREDFINEYKPFILKAVSKVTKRFVEIENSEEYSIGLMAFNESIDSYDTKYKRGFFSFSSQVIKRRIIDFIRKNANDKKTLPMTYYQKEDGVNFEEKYLTDEGSGQFENIEVEEEIIMFKNELKKYGITLKDLADCAPKHNDSKILCLNIARAIAGNDILYEKFMRTRNIPLTELLEKVKVYHGTVSRNRKYIIALTLIIKSELEVIKSYVEDFEAGGESCE